MTDDQRKEVDPKPYIIAIANEKGGVGKTTTAVSLGTILSESGEKVLLIDLDPQSNLALALGFRPHRMPGPSSNMPTKGTLFINDTYRTEYKNLDLVVARSVIIDDNHQLKRIRDGEPSLLSQSLRAVPQLPYNYILFDCPPSIEKITIDTLMITDLLLIPTQSEFFSAYSIKDMLGAIRKVRLAGNHDLKYKILITFFDRRNRIHHSIKNQLKHSFADGVFQTIIEVDTKLRESTILGIPITKFMPKSRASGQYQMLATELLDFIAGVENS